MVSAAHAKTLLRQISEKEEIAQSDIVILQAIISEMFPRTSMAAAVQKLAKPRSVITDPFGPTISDERGKEAKLLAAAGAQLIEPGLTPDRSDPKMFERRITQIVDSCFYESQPFKFAKWVLIASLVTIGAGTATFGGLSLTFWSQAGDARQKLQDATDKYDGITKQIKQKAEDLQRLQEDTIKKVQTVIEEKARDWDNELSSFVDKSKGDLSEKVRIAESFVEDQKNKVVTKVADGDAFIEGQKSKLVTDVAAAGTAIEAQKSKVSADAIAAKDHLESEKKNFGMALTAASGVIADQKGKFTTDLALLLEQTSGKIAPAIASNLSIVEQAAENGVKRISAEIQRRLDSLTRDADAETSRIHNAAEEKKNEFATATDLEIQKLGTALSGRLKEVNERAANANKSIDIVVGSFTARENSFVSALNDRLSDWDRRVLLEFKRVEDLAKVSKDAREKTDQLGVELEALRANSKAGLEVANELRSGTVTGKLPWIGMVLENSAFLFIANLAIGLLAILISIAGIILFLSKRPQPPPGEPRQVGSTT